MRRLCQRVFAARLHLAYFISDTIDILNLSAFHARYAKDGARNPPFHPLMMGQGVGLCPDLIVSYKEIGVNHLDNKRDENETKSF